MIHDRRRRPRRAIYTAALLTTFPSPAPAADYTWAATTSAGGNFNTFVNWSPNTGAPTTSSDAAFFTSPNAYPVIFPGNLTTGSATASAGTITLVSSGGQRTWTLTTFSDTGSAVTVGTSGNPLSLVAATLNVTGPGSLTSKFSSDITSSTVNVGTAGSPADVSTLTLDGSGSALTVTSGMNIGANGTTGSVYLQNGAAATLSTNSAGLTLAGDTTGTGQLRLLSGSTLSTPSLSAGTSAGGTGSAYLLVDASSSLTVTGALTAGAPTGPANTTLSVASAGTLNTGITLIDKTASLSTAPGAALNVSGNLTIRGTASFNPSTLHLANSKTLTLSNGGSATFYNGYTTPASSTTHVDAATLTTQQLTSDDNADFSLGANAILDVTHAGTFAPRRLTLGDATANTTLTIDGTGSSLTTAAGAGPSYVGTNNGSATLTVRHGATATFNDTLHVGSVGSSSNGTLNVQSSAAVTLHDLYLTTSSLSACTGTVNVTDPGSTLTITGDLYAGTAASTSAITVYTGATLVQGTSTLPTPINARIGTGGGVASLAAGTTLHVAGGSVSLGALLSAGPGTLQLDSGSLGFAGSLPIDLTGPMGPTVSLPYGSSLALTGDTTLSPGSILSLTGGALATGSLVNNGGTLSFSYGTLAITGPSGFSVGPATPLGNAATLSTGQTLLISAATTINPGASFSLVGGALTTNTLTNNGQLTVNYYSNATVQNGLTNAPTGRLTIGPDLTFTVNGPSSNAGRLTLQGATGRLLGTGALTNTGVITGDGEFAKDLLNSPTGELRADLSQHLLFSGPSPTTNSGKINLLAGTVEFTAPLTNSPTGSITGRGALLVPAGLTNDGALSLSAGTTDVRGPVTNHNTILVTGASTTTFYDPFVNAPGASVYTAAGSAVVFLAPVTGTGSFAGPGTKYFADGSSTTAPLESSGVTVVDAPASLTTPDLVEQSLTVDGRLSILPTSQGGSTSHLQSLTIGPTGTFDLADTTLLLTPPDPSTIEPTLTQLRQYLQSHQLTSSAADPTHRLGYLDAGSTVTITLTLTGDANRDGLLNADDYALLDRAYARSLSNAHWQDGDFNYDGTVDQQDYLLIDTTLGQAQGFSPGFLSQRESQFGEAYVSQLLTSVPEPSLALIFLTVPLASRTLRRHRRPSA